MGASIRTLSVHQNDPVGLSFVLGLPNAEGKHILWWGEKRWEIASEEALEACQRVRVKECLGGRLQVCRESN